MERHPFLYVLRNLEWIVLSSWASGGDTAFSTAGRIRIDVPSSVQCSYLEEDFETLFRKLLIKGVSYWPRGCAQTSVVVNPSTTW